MKLTAEVIDLLEECTVEGGVLKLPPRQLPRPEYEAVNKALECLGGKWNRKARGHVFEADPSDALEDAIRTGVVTDAKKEFQFFETPEPVAKRAVELAKIGPTDLVLEPEAGRAAIARHIPKCDALGLVELNPANVQYLRSLKLTPYIFHCDFMLFNAANWTRIVMNPPFTRQQDIDHVMHAFELLRGGGKLSAVMSEGTFFRDNRKALDFRDLLNRACVHQEKLPQGSFNGSGTGVNTRIVVLEKR